MPLSDTQIQQAKSIDLLSYLQAHEPLSIRKSGRNEYCLKEHDSLKISNGRWNWFSRGFGGYGALDFLIKVRGYEFVEAVKHLTDSDINQIHNSTHPSPKVEVENPPKIFTLPLANANNDRIIAYLRSRGIGSYIINQCIIDGTIYESKSHNVVFVGFDGTVPKFACERGTMDNYKRDVFGSNKKFGFVLPPKNLDTNNLVVTEGAVDVLAHATIHKINGDKLDGYRLSLGGVSSLALISFLDRHSEISNVQLCLDNDNAGRQATKRIISELLIDYRFREIKINISPPPLGKDYAETLQAILELYNKNIRHDRHKKAVNFI